MAVSWNMCEVLEYLNKPRYFSSKEIADEFNISVNTVRGKMKILADEMADSGAELICRRSLGYMLNVLDEEVFRSFCKENFEHGKIPVSKEERITSIYEMLVEQKDFIKIGDISQKYYISEKTVSADINELEKQLEQYHLTLIRKPYYGIKLQGSEVNIRRCLATVRSTGMSSLRKVYDYEPAMRNVFRVNRFDMSDIAFRSLMDHIDISIERYQKGMSVDLMEMFHDLSVNKQEIEIADQIGKVLKKIRGIELPESELMYIAWHLEGKKTLYQVDNNPETEIGNLVRRLVKEVYDTQGYDFREDLELYTVLVKHLIPMKVRFRYGSILKNPMLAEIKQKYPLAYEITKNVSYLIEDAFGNQMTEHEAGYIALAFELALQRYQKNVTKKNVLLILDNGQLGNRFVEEKFKKTFSSSVDKVLTCQAKDIQEMDFSEIDCVFATESIDYSLPVPIYKMSYFIEDDVDNIAQALESSRKDIVRKCFKDKLFVVMSGAQTKSEVIQRMCKIIKEHMNVSNDFYERVMKREELLNTAFDNMIAMPHPYQLSSKETFVCVCVLENRIMWGDREVQVVFLVSLAKGDTVTGEPLYEVLYQLMSKKECIHRIVKGKNFETLKAIIEQLI